MPRKHARAPKKAKVRWTWAKDPAVLLSLLGGAIVLLSGLSAFSPGSTAGLTIGLFLGHGLIDKAVLATTPSTYIFYVSTVSGFFILYSAVMMLRRPAEKRNWGIIAIIFSFISFTSAIGSLLGPIIGVVGGIAAMAEGWTVSRR